MSHYSLFPRLFGLTRPVAVHRTGRMDANRSRRATRYGMALLLGAVVALPGSLQAQGAGSEEDLLVLAAASLSDVLPGIASSWEAQGGGKVVISFAATSRLAPQVVQGAPADLFFSADEAWMDWVEERGGIDRTTRRVIAGNRLVVAVPADQVTAPRALADLQGPGVGRLALAGEHVPAGRYAQQALQGEGLWAPVSPKVVRGGSARGTLEWIARSEVDAGIVYATDARAEPRVRVAFEVPAELHGPIRYAAAVTTRSANAPTAQRFLDFVGGQDGTAAFAASGFAGPTGPTPVQYDPASPGLQPNPWSAVRLSLVVAFLATLIGLVPAIAAGWVLARKEFPGKSLLATALLAPLVLPPVVTGFLLLSLFGAQSPLGRWLTELGIQVPFTLLGASLAALIVGLPLYVMAVRGAFQAVDPHYEEVSWTLGVQPYSTFLRVTLPLALPGIAAGAVLAFARALGEFGATIVLAGNMEGSTRTIALAVYSLLESPSGRGAIWILVGSSVAISLAALLGFEALTRRQRARVEDRRV